MRKVTAAEILDIARYELLRDEFRRKIIARKKKRRLSVGPQVSFVFENHDTVLFQIQEMMRAERLVHAAAIQHEIDTYNQLLPEPGELAATMFIELQDAARLRTELAQFQGVNTGEATFLQIGAARLPGVFAEGQSDEQRISAVQYVRFRFNEAQRAAFTQGESPVQLVISHPTYSYSSLIEGELRRELSRDFSADDNDPH